jgi:hypothetical protein
MRIVYQRCCGMDIHKDSITACLLLISSAPSSDGAYNNAVHFMIRCEPWIMSNLA